MVKEKLNVNQCLTNILVTNIQLTILLHEHKATRTMLQCEQYCELVKVTRLFLYNLAILYFRI